MSRKVIYISFSHLCEKTERDWHINYLIARGVVVEYWDVVSLVFGEDGHSSKQTDYLRTPKTYQEIETALRLPENKGAYYVMLAIYEGRTVKLYRLLSKHDAQMLFFSFFAAPGESSGRGKQIFHGIFSNPLDIAKKIFNKVKAKTYRQLNLIKPFKFVFAAGQALLESGQSHAAKVVPINTIEYDNYVKVFSEEGRLVKGRYAVFLDINLAKQSDLAICGLKAVDAGGYHRSLNNFFKLLELQYGVKVVIAAHPTADYSAETFDGREIYRSVTPVLVRDAEFVISHHSASIGYAVLNRKPIIFVYTEEMKALYKHTVVMKILHGMADFLGAPIYNISEVTECDLINISDVNSNRYDGYKYSFLTTHESEYTTTQEIFWREINAR